MKLYTFRTVRLSIISSSFTVHSEMVYVIQLSSRTIGPARKLRYTIAECTVNKLLMMGRRTVRNV